MSLAKLEIVHGDLIVNVNVTSFTPDQPAKISQVWEDSYPAEQGDVEFDIISTAVSMPHDYDIKELDELIDFPETAEFARLVFDSYVEHLGLCNEL